MKPCEYCGSTTNKLTREHIIPTWYLSTIERRNYFSEKSKSKFITEPTIKDVCNECNNGKLAKLDGYGKELYESFFKDYIYKKETVLFKYDYNKLFKWLIKCSYNISRTTRNDINILRQYISIVMNEEEVPSFARLYCSTVSPSIINDNDYYMALRDENSKEIFCPESFGFRTGRIFGITQNEFCLRSVRINSFMFHLILPNFEIKEIKEYKHKLALIISTSSKYYGWIKLDKLGVTNLKQPKISTFDCHIEHMLNNPKAYSLVKGELVHSGDKDFYVITIPRIDIETKDFTNIKAYLKGLISSRESLLPFIKKMEFCIDGYNEDSRELYEIKEVREYVRKLNKFFPYWLLFLHEASSFINLLITCASTTTLKTDSLTERFSKAIEPKILKRIIDNLFDSLEKICFRYGINDEILSELREMNVKKIYKVIQLKEEIK